MNLIGPYTTTAGLPGSRAFLSAAEVRRQYPQKYIEYLEARISFEEHPAPPEEQNKGN